MPYWSSIARLGLDKLMSPKTTTDIELFKNFVGTAVKERLAFAESEKSLPESELRKDFFYWLTNAKDPETGGDGYTTGELWAEARLLVAAGSDTSSTTLAALFFYLSRNPKVLARLQFELRSTFSRPEEIVSGPTLAGCQYLRAVIEETLRAAPPVPSSLPRQILTGGMTVDGEFLPEGTIVGVCCYAMHYNEEYFDEPASFKPERWIVNEDTGVTKETVDRARSAFFPFSLGNRGCVGKPMAYAELSLAVGRVSRQILQQPLGSTQFATESDKYGPR